MNLSSCKRDGTLVIRLEEDSLDAAQTQRFKQQVIDLIAQEQKYNLIFDLSQLRFIDSSGLGAFLSLLRYVNAKDGDLKLADMSPNVHTMFELVRMHKLFEILPSVDECCRSFATH